MSVGYIKLHRSLLDWQYWDDHNTTRLLVYFLISVNYEKKKWMGIEINPGSMVCSYDKISAATGLSIQQIRRSIKMLVNDNQLVQKTTNKYQLIILVKWDELQLETINDNRQTTGKQQANNRQTTTTKESIIITSNNNTEEGEEGKELTSNDVYQVSIETPKKEPIEKIDFDGLLKFYNNLFTRKCRVVNDQVKKKYKARLKEGYIKEQIIEAMEKAKKVKSHIDSDFMYLTLEFFARAETLDKYGTLPDKPIQKQIQEIKSPAHNPYIPIG